MIYLYVKWLHSFSSEPIHIYSELDDRRWEQRKVEVYADGRMEYASTAKSSGESRLSKEPIPLLEAIADDPQFEPTEIDQVKFEQIWQSAIIN